MNYRDGLERLAGKGDYSAPEHRSITREDLERLKQQIDMALEIPESEMHLCTYSERIQGVAKYGPGAVCIGDFVIKRR